MRAIDLHYVLPRIVPPIVPRQRMFRVDKTRAVWDLDGNHLIDHLGGNMLDVADGFTKLKVGVAASALATAAVLTPAVVAEAKPLTLPDISASPLTSMFGSDPIEGPITFSTATPWWWIGNSPNPNPALISFAPLSTAGTTIIDFQPLSLVPGFLQPIVGAFLNLIPKFNVCVAGLGVSLSAYGRVTVKTSAC